MTCPLLVIETPHLWSGIGVGFRQGWVKFFPAIWIILILALTDDRKADGSAAFAPGNPQPYGPMGFSVM
ncbi:hypothetical protein TPY_1947 [Sulfobacillus acidophilus TPY]|nr:hypothetical protein TPY_1947 [Sulfobacillus acidophilus TPY]